MQAISLPSCVLLALSALPAALPDIDAVTEQYLVNDFAPGTESRPALAWSGNFGLVVYRTDLEELRGQQLLLVNDTIANFGSSFLIRDTFGTGQIGPPSAGLLETELGPRFVVTWSREANIAQDREVEFMLLTPSVAAAGTVVPLTDTPSSQEDVEPRVSPRGDGSATIVWKRSGVGILAANVGTHPSGVGTILNSFALSTNANDSQPDVVRWDEDGTSTQLAVWHRDDPGAAQSLRARYWEGTAASSAEPELEAFGSPFLSLGRPDLAASGPGDFFLVWDRAEPVGGTTPPRDVLGRRLFWPGATPRLGPVVEIIATVGADDREPQVAFAGDSHVLASKRSSTSVPGLVFLRAVTLDTLSGLRLDGFGINLEATASEYRGFALAARTTGALGFDRVLAGWAEWNGVLENVWASSLEPTSGIHQPYPSTGCSDGGRTVLGTADASNPSFRMELWNSEPGGAAYMVIGEDQVLLSLGDGLVVPSLSTSSVFFGGAVDADGYFGAELSLPAGLSGIDFYGQWFTVTPGALQCTGYVVDLSAGFRMQFD